MPNLTPQTHTHSRLLISLIEPPLPHHPSSSPLPSTYYCTYASVLVQSFPAHSGILLFYLILIVAMTSPEAPDPTRCAGINRTLTMQRQTSIPYLSLHVAIVCEGNGTWQMPTKKTTGFTSPGSNEETEAIMATGRSKRLKTKQNNIEKIYIMYIYI